MFENHSKLHLKTYKDFFSTTTFDDAYTHINEQRFTKNFLGISYRELNHWSTKGLLFENNEAGKWRKFSILELVWIEIVKELRRYNFSLKLIKELKDELAVKTLNTENGEELKMETVLAIWKVMYSAAEYEQVTQPDILSDLFPDGKLALPAGELQPLNLFGLHVIEAYFLKIETHLIANPEGDIVFINALYRNDFKKDEVFNLFNRSHISISLNEIISGIFQDFGNDELKFQWQLINDTEHQLLKILQSEKKMKSIKIRYNKDSQIELLEYTEELKVTPQDYLKKIMVSGAYQDIKVITQKGDIVLCERTIKQKLKK